VEGIDGQAKGAVGIKWGEGKEKTYAAACLLITPDSDHVHSLLCALEESR
jgi:hypothetical protein